MTIRRATQPSRTTTPGDQDPSRDPALRTLYDALAVDDSDLHERIFHSLLADLRGHEGEAVEPLLGGVASDWESVREFSVQILGCLGVRTDAVVRGLRHVLRHDSAHPRILACIALIRLQEESKRAWAYITTVLKESDRALIKEAASALAGLGKRALPAVPALAQLVERNEDDDTRVHAAECLGEIGWEAYHAIDALRSALRHQNPRVRRAAAKALGKVLHPQLARVVLGQDAPDLLDVIEDGGGIIHPLPPSFESLSARLAGIEKKLAQERPAFQDELRALERANFQSLEANRQVASVIQEIAERLRVAFICPKCNQPARFKCVANPTSPTGVFSFGHPRVTHGGTTAIPLLTLCEPAEDGRQTRGTVPAENAAD